MRRAITLLVAALLAVGAAACGGDSDQGAAAATDTAADTSSTTGAESTEGSDTNEPTTGESTGGTASEPIEVSFDGNECTVAGASEMPAGDRSFVLTDMSDLDGVTVFARKLVDGHSFQDALDIEAASGGPGAYWPRPSWAADVMPNFDPPEMDLADNQQLLAVSLEPGEHLVAIYAINPELIWLCAPLDVVES